MHFLLVTFLAFGLTNLASAWEVKSQVGSCLAADSCDCENSTPGQFSVCAEDSVAGGGSGSVGTGGAGIRECKYFANGTIDVPTMTVITAWVPIGSRPCIGDEIADPNSSPGSWSSQVEIELRGKFTALATRPISSWAPGGEVEIQEPIELRVDSETELFSGTLLGRSAQIRFRPVSTRWEISDGSELYGFRKYHSFNAAGSYFAKAFVKYEVDYRHFDSNWVFSAARWELSANKLAIVVIERERRTLLVG
jgi:hypothetical protein